MTDSQDPESVISVVIPAFNEQRALPATLDRLYAQSGDFEAILVDGGSSDATRAIAGRYEGLRIIDAPKGRASQMNAGAAIAKGEWLLFLHADTLLPEDALDRIAGLPAGVSAGGFRHRFSGTGFGLRLVSLLDNLRCRATRVIFGDQAMFVRRTLFERVGGFPDVQRLEDVLICDEMIKHTRPVLLRPAVVTDSRKFEEQGVWRSLLRVGVILLYANLGRKLPDFSLRFFEDVR